MKIVFFSRLFFPHIGGVERHVMEVSKVLIEMGHDVSVITEKLDSDLKIPHPDPATPVSLRSQASSLTSFSPPLRGEGSLKKTLKGEEEIIEGIKVYRISVGGEDWFKKFRIWKELWRLQKIIAESDVVHCHDVFFWYMPFKFIFPKKPVYTTFHGYETTYPPTQQAITVRKLSKKLSWGNICVGDFIKKWYGTKTDFVTYGGVAKIQKFKLTIQTYNSKLKIAFIGRLDEDTDVIFYKQVLHLLKQKKVTFSFDVYGDGPLKKDVEKTGKVHGSVSNINEAIAKADIIFASSYLSILESLAQKKLVFATYSNPLKEDYLRMAPFAKFIIIENDPEKMAEKVAYFIKYPKDAESLINHGYDWVKNQTWENVTNLYLRLWKR